MGKIKFVLAFIAILGVTAAVSAAPVGLTSEADATASTQAWSDAKLGVSIGVTGDAVSERKIDIDKGEFEMQAYTARLGLSILDRVFLYGDVGSAIDMEYAYTMMGESHNVEMEDGLIWGLGANALLFRADNGIEVGGHVSYRQADMELDKATIAGISYTKSQLTNVVDGDFKEWQAALEIAWKTDMGIIPYAGVKYSEVEVSAEYKLAPTLYSAKEKNAGENVGVFAGLTFIPKISSMPLSEQITINVEGRFIDETAVNAGISYKF